jgi:hypothetical protein
MADFAFIMLFVVLTSNAAVVLGGNGGSCLIYIYSNSVREEPKIFEQMRQSFIFPTMSARNEKTTIWSVFSVHHLGV